MYFNAVFQFTTIKIVAELFECNIVREAEFALLDLMEQGKLKGNASKYDICMEAYAWTKDEELLYNDHMADAFACCFYTFIKELKESCAFHGIPVPQRFSYLLNCQ